MKSHAISIAFAAASLICATASVQAASAQTTGAAAPQGDISKHDTQSSEDSLPAQPSPLTGKTSNEAGDTPKATPAAAHRVHHRQRSNTAAPSATPTSASNASAPN